MFYRHFCLEFIKRRVFSFFHVREAEQKPFRDSAEENERMRFRIVCVLFNKALPLYIRFFGFSTTENESPVGINCGQNTGILRE